MQSQNLIFDCFDQLSSEDSNSRVAAKKLKTRVIASITIVKTEISKPKVNGSQEEMKRLKNVT